MNRRRFLFSASIISLGIAVGLLSPASAFAETEATIVIGRQESGAASYDPIRAVTLNIASVSAAIVGAGESRPVAMPSEMMDAENRNLRRFMNPSQGLRCELCGW